MAKQRNFLLGNGHRLTSPVRIGKKIEPKPPPYNLAEAKTRLSDQFIAAAASFSELPNAACPDGYAVGIITLHPEYIAKSFFPADLLREARMEAIGSRPSRVTPEKWKKKKDPEDVPTTDLFVAARREDFQSFARELASITDEDKSANDLFKVEAFHAPKPSDRVQKIRKSVDQPMLEVVLHTSGIPRPARILQAFEAYAEMLGLDPDLDRRFEVSGLCFLPVRAPRSKIEALSNFSFLRTIREMPELRPLRPIIRTSAKSKPFPVTMPTAPPIDKQLRAAVFDGGISDTMHHSPYAQSHEPSGIGAVVDGHGSSSSLWSKFNSARNQVIACALLRVRKKLPIREVGWGRVPQDIEAIVICPDGQARVVYQGELTPGQYLRTPVPLPAGKLDGMVSLTATFCFACQTDPNDPSNYTRGGLDVIFRPHVDKFGNEDAMHPKSSSFFRRTDYDTEKELRLDAHKWETTLHRQRNFRHTTLKDPAFDVHYQVRESGQPSAGEKIKYALIITVSAPKVSNLYDRIVQRYQTQLEPMVPVIEVPIRNR